MIGVLPTTLVVNGEERAIRSDYRVALIIFQALNDPELDGEQRAKTMLECLYVDSEEIDPVNYEEACKKAVLYLDGMLDEKKTKEKKQSPKLMDWEQDEQMIFSAINKVAGCEVRVLDYLHWWTFLGYYNEIGEGLFSSVIQIRQKQATGKKLEKYEIEFYRKNRDMIDLKTRYSEDEQAEKDRLLKLLKS